MALFPNPYQNMGNMMQQQQQQYNVLPQQQILRANGKATNANFTALIQGVKDMMANDKIESLQNQLNAMTLQNALSNVVRYPTNTFYAVPSPCFNTCGCGCGNI